MTTALPETLYIIPHRTCGYIGSPHSTEEFDTAYIRKSLSAAREAALMACIAELAFSCASVNTIFQHNYDTKLRDRPSRAQCDAMWFNASEAVRKHAALITESQKVKNG